MSFLDWFRSVDKSKLSDESTSSNPFSQKTIYELAGKTVDNLENGEYYFQKGRQAAQFKDFDGAIELFNKSLEYADYASMVYVGRGAIYQFQERFLDARDDFIKALELEDSSPSDFKDEVINAVHENYSRIELTCNFNDAHGETVRGQIKQDGVDYAAKRFGEVICEKLKGDAALIHQFILEELEELDELGKEKLEFSLQSGVERTEYKDAVNSVNHQPAHDEASLFFKQILCCLSREPSTMFDFRTLVLTKIMEKYSIGKY